MANKILSYILKSKLIVLIINMARRVSFPLSGGVPLSKVIGLFYRGIIKGGLNARAASTAFNFFLAIFPSIIFLFTLIPYIPIDNFQNELMDLLKEFMPKAAYQATESTLEDIIRHHHSGLLSFGF